MDLDSFGPIESYYAKNSGDIQKGWYWVIGIAASAGVTLFIVWQIRRNKTNKDKIK
jgi:hypothetical protein